MYDGMRRAPDQPNPGWVKHREIPRLVFVEDRLLREFEKRNPQVTTYDPKRRDEHGTRLLGRPALASAVVAEQMRRMQEGASPEEAAASAQRWAIEHGRDLLATMRMPKVQLDPIQRNMGPSITDGPSAIMERVLQDQTKALRDALAGQTRQRPHPAARFNTYKSWMAPQEIRAIQKREPLADKDREALAQGTRPGPGTPVPGPAVGTGYRAGGGQGGQPLPDLGAKVRVPGSLSGEIESIVGVLGARKKRQASIAAQGTNRRGHKGLIDDMEAAVDLDGESAFGRLDGGAAASGGSLEEDDEDEELPVGDDDGWRGRRLLDMAGRMSAAGVKPSEFYEELRERATATLQRLAELEDAGADDWDRMAEHMAEVAAAADGGEDAAGLDKLIGPGTDTTPGAEVREQKFLLGRPQSGVLELWTAMEDLRQGPNGLLSMGAQGTHVGTFREWMDSAGWEGLLGALQHMVANSGGQPD